MHPDYERLRRSARRRVRRCARAAHAHGAPVLIKRRVASRRAADCAALRRECALAAGLSSAATLLPRMVELRRRRVLVMEDPGGDLLLAR